MAATAADGFVLLDPRSGATEATGWLLLGETGTHSIKNGIA